MKALQKKWLSLPRSLRWPLVIGFYLSLIGGYMLWQYLRPQGAALYGNNHTGRRIFDYWINDGWGGNGGVTCCWRVQGRELNVVWVYSRTRAQIEQKMDKERHELIIANPARDRGDRYLHVHFFPGNEVRVAWSPNHDSPYEDMKEAPPLAKKAEAP